MWWAGSKSVDVFLGQRRVLVGDRCELLHAEVVEGLEAGIQSLDQWLSGQPGRWKLRVWLSGALCRVFVQAPLPGIRESDLQRIVEAEAPRRTGLAPPCAMWREPGRRMQQQAAAVVEQRVLDSIWRWRDTQKSRLKVRSVGPWWSEPLCAVQARQPDCHALVVDDLESLTIFSGAPGELDAAMSIVPVGDGAATSGQRQRALFGLGLDDAAIRTVTLASAAVGDAVLSEHDEILPVAFSARIEQQ